MNTFDWSSIRTRPPIACADSSTGSSSTLEFMVIDIHVQDGCPSRADLLSSPLSRFQANTYIPSASDPAKSCYILLYGVNTAGNSIYVEISDWHPWLRIEVPDTWTAADTDALRQSVSEAAHIPMSLVGATNSKYKRLCGWQPGEAAARDTRLFHYITLSVPTLSLQRTILRMMRSGSLVPPSSLCSSSWTVVDALQSPKSLAQTDLNISPSGWVSVQNPVLRLPHDDQASHCQLEYMCSLNDVSSIERDEIAPLVIASFDCEMYSHDGTFPSVGKGDFTYCVCTTFTRHGLQSSPTKKVAIFVGDSLTMSERDDTIVVCVASSADLLVAWRHLIIQTDPDIVVSWNGKGFDIPFLAQEHAQARMDSVDRGSEGLHAVLCRKAHEILGTWTESTPLPLLSNLSSKLGRSRFAAIKSVEKSFDSYKPSIIRSLLMCGDANSRQSQPGQTSLDNFYDGDDSDSDSGSDLDRVNTNLNTNLNATCPSWVGPMLKSGALLECIAAKARAALLKAAGVPEHSAPTTLRKMLTQLRAKGLDDHLWSWARQCLGHGIVDMMTSPSKHGGVVNLGMMLSRASMETCVLQEKQMTTAAKGDNLFSTIAMRGRAVIDLMHIVKEDKKPESNALSFAAKKWLGGAEHDKIDMPVSEIFALYRRHQKGEANAARPVVEYCVQDSLIPLWLIEKLQYIPTWIEQSRICYTALDAVCNGGQQAKVFNLISRFIHNEFVVNDPDSGWPAEDDTNDLGGEDAVQRLRKKVSDYEGATVIPPQSGFYTDPISTLDFASLYPSIMISFNLCPSTLYRGSIESLNLLRAKDPSVTFDVHRIRHNLAAPDKGGGVITVDRDYIFVTHVQSLLSRLLLHLLNTRKAVKKTLAAATDPSIRSVLKGRELGLKLCANSAYGFMGVSSKRGMLPCKPVAAVTTLKGRDMIEATRRHVESAFPPARVVYGDTDSVMIHWGPGISLHEAYALGEKAADEITKKMRSGTMEGVGGAGSLSNNARRDATAAASIVKLEHEKEYLPYLLFKKKNYAGIKHVPGGSESIGGNIDGKIVFQSEIDIKGIDAVRRDRSLLLRTLSMDVLNALLRERSVDNALMLLKQRLQDIAERKVSNDLFVLSKQTKSYYSTDSVVHDAAWRRMRDRGDEGLPPIGARMPFLIVASNKARGNSENSKLYERAEHPSYVERMNLPLDYTHYIRSLQNPIVKLMQFSSSPVEQIFKDALQTARLKGLGIGSLASFLGGGGASTTKRGGFLEGSSVNKAKKPRPSTSSVSVQDCGGGLKKYFGK